VGVYRCRRGRDSHCIINDQFPGNKGGGGEPGEVVENGIVW